MRTILLFDNVSATTEQVSESVQFEQDSRWMLSISSTGLSGGVPYIQIEVSVSNNESVWHPLKNTEKSLPDDALTITHFPLDAPQLAIKHVYLPAKFIRVRIVPNGATGGNITIDLGYKTRV